MKKACLIFLLGTIIFSLLVLQVRHPLPSEAQTPTGNQVGINITDVDPNRFLQAAKTVGPGGWITVIATAGQAPQLQKIFDINQSLGNQGVQVVVRRETWGRTPTAEDALSFAAMYGNLDTHGQQVYDMPWNEPNNFAWWDFSTIDQSARAGATYFQASYQALRDAGLYDNKVIFMAPMVDQFRGNGAEYYQLLRQYDPNVMSYFQAVPMNLYVRYDPNTHNPSTNIVDSGTRYREVLEKFGFTNATNIPVLALEIGVIIGYGNPIYPPEYPGWLNFYNFLSHVTNAWRADPNFFGFTPLSSASYGNDYLLRELATVLQQFITPGAVGIYDLSQIQKIFEEWLKAAGLIECLDKEGNFIGYALDESGCQNLLALLLPTPTYPTCTSPSAETRVSRPDECTTCNLEPPLTYACATTFAVHDTVSWKWEDSDFICEPTGEHWVERDWGGTITIDAGDVKVPFVGKKGEEDVQKYLADYFEGTAFYYGPDIDLDDCRQENPNEAEREACQEAVKRVVMEGGIFRKLAPKELQDELKEALIDRAKKSLAGQIEDGIHDYLIEHAGVSRRLTEINPPPKLPVKAKEEEYQEWQKAYKIWKKTDSGKLWPAVPMFSREDSPGQVMASVNTKRADVATVIPPVQEEQVPHLARLFEVTRELRNLLMPWLEEEEAAKAPAKALLASSNPQVLGEKKLLAQGGNVPATNCPGKSPEYEWCEPDCDACWKMALAGICCSGGNLTVSVDAYGHGHINIYANGAHIGSSPLMMGGEYHGPGFCPTTEGAQYNVSVRVENYHYHFDVVGGCTITLGADGVGCCGQFGPPISEPKCGLAEPMPYPACEYESVTDDNPNDTICCNPINIDLNAVDQFANPNYTGPCIWFTDPATGVRTLLNPDCRKTETRHVHRDVKVDLFHPYLEEIWDQTTDSFRGLFNIFRPEVEPVFEDLDAHSYIEYSYPSGSITPEAPWKFYFPHLGGIQKAKEWVLETLNPSGGGGTTGRASPLPPTLLPTPTPVTGPTTLNYTLDFRNPNLGIAEATKEAIIEAVKRSWPETEIEERWDYVYTQAVVNGWNPAFVIALWIEESGAGHLDNWDLGCTAGEKNNITSQLFCLFDLPYKNAPFEEFMCRYSEGHYPCQFEINPNFPGNLKYWYDQLQG